MRRFVLEKLVHDDIVQGHLDEGGTVNFEVLEGGALVQALEAKLIEETAEFEKAVNKKDKHKERQDINNVLFALGRLAISDFVPTKTFAKGHYVHTVEVPNDSWLADYYAADPERFPEILESN